MKKVIISLSFLYLIFIGIGFILHSESVFTDITNTTLFAEKKTFSNYFFHNSKILKNSIVGMSSLGMLSIFQLAINGIFLGVGLAEMTVKLSLIQSLLFIFPHGFFEIPALILATAIGLYPIRLIFLFLVKNKSETWKGMLLKQLKMLLFIIFVIFIFAGIAAMLEANITPWLIKRYL